MKKQFLLLAGLAAVLSAAAQQKSAGPEKVSFGIKAGLNSASIKGEASESLNGMVDYTDGIFNTESRTGFYAGGTVNIPVGGGFSIEPGILYDQKGYVLQGSYGLKDAEFLSLNGKARLNLNYISLPVLVKGTFGGFQAFAGPQVSYLAQAQLHATAGALGFNVFNKRYDVADQFNKVDFGLTGGIGYQFNNGFHINAAYDHGLGKIDADRSLDAYNRAFKVGVGFRF
ncbi:porin family protein [Flaviaesturariibacter amylovorans]|uniref:Outer membrane protein beta-barrel domain-containing protein n=1 Tax=Flaviaesturariibacter amylovorans TaxID=1084520 RepID=A0ABP8HUT5_9BACT